MMFDRSKKILALGFPLLLWILIIGSPSVQAQSDLVRIGVLAKRGAAHCLAKWGPTADYLTRKIEGKRFVIVPLDFDRIFDAATDPRTDFILTNPSFYVELEHRFGVNRIATLRNLRLGKSYTFFAGVIFSRADRTDIRQFDDLHGKTFMAVKESSLGGWQMAWRELLEHDIDPFKDFKNVRFGGTHDTVVYAVLRGDADVGTVRTDTLERMEVEGKLRLSDFHVIPHQPHNTAEVPFVHSTRTYPEWPMAKNRHTSDRLAQRVAIELLQMSPDSAAAKAAKCAGWTIPLNYQPVHDCLKALKIGPYSTIGQVSLGEVINTYWPALTAITLVFALLTGLTFIIAGLNRRLSRSHQSLLAEASERQRVVLALEESEQFTRTIIASVCDGIIVYDAQLRFLVWNAQMETITGLAADAVLGKTVTEVFPNLKKTGIDRLLARSMDGKTVRARDSQYHVPQTGKRGWITGVYSPHVDANGNTIGIVAAIRDVTGRKAAVDALKDSNERFRTVMDSLDALVYVADMDTYELLYINRFGRRIWGDAVGKTCWQVLQTDQVGPCEFCSNPKLLDDQGRPTGVYVWEFQNTVNERWYECRDQAIRWLDGRYVRVEIASDISDSKLAEKRLREQNQFLSSVLDSLTHPFLVLDADTYQIKMANGAVGENWEGKTCYEFTHHRNRPCRGKNHPCPIRIIKQSHKPAILEHIHYSPTGEPRNVEVHGYPIFDDNGRISQIIEYALDITTRKRAEAALREQEAYLRTIMGTIQTGVLITDRDTGRVADANRYATRLLGQPKKSLIDQPWEHFLKQEKNRPRDFPPPDQLSDSEDYTLQTKDKGPLNVRVTQADTRFRSQRYSVKSFSNITDIRNLLNQQSVNIEMAKRLLELVNPEPDRFIHLPGHAGLHLEPISMSCSAAGGDHYLIKQLPGRSDQGTHRTVLSLKDQSGHEVNCVLKSIVTDLIHNALLHQEQPLALDECITRLNRQLLRTQLFRAEDFLTAVTVEIDHRTLEMQYLNCGHPDFLLIRGTQIKALPGSNDHGRNLPLGSFDDINFTTGRYQLQVGDRLLFYTDGLIEMPLSKKGYTLSADHLIDLVAQILEDDPHCAVTDIVRRLLSSITALSDQQVEPFQRNSSADDVTLIGLEIENRHPYNSRDLQPANLTDLCESVGKLAPAILSDWSPNGRSDDLFRIRTVLEEAVMNAFKNGHRQATDRPITVRWRQGNDFHLEVIDRGPGFSPEHLPDPTTAQNRRHESGRGIYMMRLFADHLTWRRMGRHLIATFFRHPYRRNAAEPNPPLVASPLWQTTTPDPHRARPTANHYLNRIQ